MNKPIFLFLLLLVACENSNKLMKKCKDNNNFILKEVKDCIVNETVMTVNISKSFGMPLKECVKYDVYFVNICEEYRIKEACK
ncbi:MAG: hypothetical protein LBG48_03245 [Rickettsiales bacterium]|jgi:hypothetical protein|nr:hypothetical protein [Rickettsiales bacterium]